MSEDYLLLCADVRAKLYAAAYEELKPIATELLTLLNVEEATRAKTLSVFEEYISKTSKEEDGGIATLTHLSERLKLKTKTVVTEPDSAKADSAKESSTVKGSVSGTYMFRKDFKISGQIDLKSGISFTSYRRQVEDGVKKGYKEGEVIEGIIRAITPQNNLRSYLEGRPLLQLSDINSLIRSYYKEKTATELYQTLSNLTQDIKESPQEFVFRALDLRQKVLFASKEKHSGMNYDQELVQNMTLHAVLTGLKDDNIRQGFEPTLLRKGITDEELILALNSVTSRELERKSKMDRKTVKVQQVETASVEKEQQEKKPTREGMLNSEIKALRAEFDLLKHEVSKSNSVATSSVENKKKPIRQCKWCEEKGMSGKCDHCFKCGSSEHFSRGCRQRNVSHQGNSQGLH